MDLNETDRQLTDTVNRYLDDNDSPVDPKWVADMERAYPYFTLPALLELQHPAATQTDSDTIADATRRLALKVPDRAALMSTLRPEAAAWADLYPAETPAPKMSTNQAIDDFINTYGNPEPGEEETLTRLIFNPTPDYAQILAAQERADSPTPTDAPQGSQDDLINNFIIKSRQAEAAATQQADEPQAEAINPVENESRPRSPIQPSQPRPVSAPAAASSTLSESLAKIYIKQRRYAKAYEIISDLSLKFPEKSVYFADQLRFLQKLMINQSHIDRKAFSGETPSN